MAEDDEMRNHISIAHRNFLLDAAYFLYVHARYTDAQRYLDLVRQKYPAFAPSDGTVDAYALRRLGEDIEETDRDRTISNIRGVLIQSYYNLALGEDDRANGLARLALTIWNNYQGKVSTGGSEKRVGLPSMDELKASALDRLLDPQEGVMNPQLQNQLRTRLRLPVPETIVTNAPPSV
jgi:hypothetical protein